MSGTIDIVKLEESQFPVAAAVLARSFIDDPFMIYVLPDPTLRREKLPTFMEAGCRYGHLFGEAHSTAGRVDGVALWAPPGEADFTPERLETAGFGRVAEAFGEEAMGRFSGVLQYFETLHHRDMPDPHWYLFLLGVDPPWQGRGIGGQLLQPIFRRADQAGLGCYLETQKARNVPFYRKHGFEVVVDVDVPEGGPHLWTMRRPPGAG